MKRATDIVLDTLCSMEAIKTRSTVDRADVLARSGLDKAVFDEAVQTLIDEGVIGAFLDSSQAGLSLTTKGRSLCDWEN